MAADLGHSRPFDDRRSSERHFNRRLGGRVNDLRGIVQGEGLVLQGRVRPYHAKQLALQAAMEITERPILANEIRV